MDLILILQILSVLILLLLSAFFSSAETSMTTVNRIRIQSLADEGDRRARRLLSIIDNSTDMLSTILIGNNLVNISCSSLVTTLTIRLVGSSWIGASTGLLTLLVLIFGEITPKTMATLHAEKIALSYANAIYLLMIILTPAVYAVGKLSGMFMLLLGIRADSRQTAMTEKEIRTMVDESQEAGEIEPEEQQMIMNVFDFGDSTASDVMVPRIDLVFIHVDCTLNELLDIYKEDKHTRFPVYEKDKDDVIGILNVKDLLLSPTIFTDKSFSLRDYLREPYFTYEQKPTQDLLFEMRKACINLAIVLDEYGATAGLLTMEDLLEEIVGEIRDEYDTDELEHIREITPGQEYICEGSVRLDEINEKLGMHLCSEDNDSIGGYITEQLDHLALEGQSIRTPDGVRFVVDSIDRNRIELVHIFIPKRVDANPSDLSDDHPASEVN